MRVEILAGLKTVFHSIFGNKAKGRISKRVFQENKAHQFSEKFALLPY